MAFIVEIGKDKLNWNDYNYQRFQQFLRDNEGKKIRIDLVKKPVSEKMRRFYFGAVIPLIRTTCDEWKNLTGAEIHEIIKKMLFYFETYNPLTLRIERFGRSVMSNDDWNNTNKANEFLMTVGQYLVDCGIEMPDVEEWEKTKDYAPLV